MAKQIKLEFDFEREARVMDTIRGHFKVRTLHHVTHWWAAGQPDLLGVEAVFEHSSMQRDSRAVPQAQGALKRIDIPCSIPGLTTKRLLVMSFIDGLQVTASICQNCIAHDRTLLEMQMVLLVAQLWLCMGRSPGSVTAWAATQPGSGRWASIVSCRACRRRMAA